MMRNGIEDNRLEANRAWRLCFCLLRLAVQWLLACCSFAEAKWGNFAK
jgi:hypothetical protein